MKIRFALFALTAVPILFAVSCGKDPDDPVFPDNPDKPKTEKSLEPEECDNNVVAHRCGAKELGVPDNSIAALKYAMSLHCYAVECDMYLTRDNRIIIHHGSAGKVNGMFPSEHTLDEIRAAGRLSNGEDIPTLEDFLDVVCVKGNCTRLWIETKNITNEEMTDAAQESAIVGGVSTAIRIILEKEAEKFVEFNGTGRTSVFKQTYPYARSKGFNMSMATSSSASTMKSNGWHWSNYDVSSKTAAEISSIVADYKKNSVWLSLYNIDSDDLRKAVKPHVSDVKGLMTNYPRALLEALK